MFIYKVNKYVLNKYVPSNVTVGKAENCNFSIEIM